MWKCIVGTAKYSLAYLDSNLKPRFLVFAHFCPLVSGRERVGSGDRAVPDAGGVHHLLVSWSKLRPQRRPGALQRLHATARLQSAERRIVTERFLFHRKHECDCFIRHAWGWFTPIVTANVMSIDSSKPHRSKLHLIRADGRLWLADFNDVLTATFDLQCLLFLWVFGFSPPLWSSCTVFGDSVKDVIKNYVFGRKIKSENHLKRENEKIVMNTWRMVFFCEIFSTAKDFMQDLTVTFHVIFSHIEKGRTRCVYNNKWYSSMNINHIASLVIHVMYGAGQ